MRLNDVTFIVSTFFLPVWLIWELVVLYLRSRGVQDAPGMSLGTISMVMQQRAYQFNIIPFFWSSMMAHWWFNWMRTQVWSVPWFGVAFWLLLAATLVLDVVLWRAGIGYSSLPEWSKVLRAPMVQCGLGMLVAYFLFPQRASDVPGFRWW